ncbi:MAG: hypothetical protein AAFU71_08475 [Cyanobacteria bacterium J06632_22]
MSAPRAPKSSHKPLPWQGGVALLMYGFMYVPIGVLAIYSFNESRYGANWTGFSLKWYGKLFQDERLFNALGDSLKIANGHERAHNRGNPHGTAGNF